MRSPSFKRALRATIRACVVAISASNAAYADWNASLVSIPASCVVHDSGMEFLPLRFRAIAELDALVQPLPSSNDAFERIGPLDRVLEATTDHCALAAVRHANYEQLSSRIEWARNQAGWIYSAANEWIDHYPVLPISWNRTIRSTSPFVARQLISAFDKSSLPYVCPMDEALAAQNTLVGTESADSEALLWDCDQNHCGTKYQLQSELADTSTISGVDSVSEEAISSPSDLGAEGCQFDALSGFDADRNPEGEATSKIDSLPSGHPANIFVYTLQASGPTNEPFPSENRAESNGSTEAFNDLADRSLAASIASRTGRSGGEGTSDSIEGEFCSQLVSGTEIDAPILGNRFPIEEGCIPSTEFLPGGLNDTIEMDEPEGAPAIATTPEHLVKTMRDSAAPISVVPDQIGVTASDIDAVSLETELCAPMASNSGDGQIMSDVREVVANAIEINSIAADRIPIDPALNMGLDNPSESWRSLFRPHGCIFAPEYLIDQPSVGIRSNTEIEPDPISDDLIPVAPMNRDLAALDAALRDPVGIGFEIPANSVRWDANGTEETNRQAAVMSDSVRWSDAAWVGYAHDVAADSNVRDADQGNQPRDSDEVSRTPMTKVFAKGLRWFADRMVQWSDALESQIRMAEGSEMSSTHDR